MFSSGSVDSSRIVYTPSSFAKSTLLHLQEAGTLTALMPHTSARSKLTSYLFFIVLEGHGKLEYAGRAYPLSAGDCIFIDCMSPYAHTTSDDLWKLQWVHFYGENMGGIYAKYLERGGLPVFQPPKMERYTKILDRLLSVATSEDYLRDMRINELLSILLTRIMEMSWLPENQVNMKRGVSREYSLTDVKNYLEENWAKKITLDDLSDQFFINKYYLTRLFRNQFGRSILNFVMDIRITQAKRMLRFTDKPVSEISCDCGFDDQNYFARIFKRIEGTTPTEYRRMWVQ